MMPVLRSVLLFAIALTLASCANKPVRVINAETAKLTHFQVKGGLGIWTEQQNISARMLWQQRADDYSFSLTAPLGMASMQLDKQGAIAIVTRADAVVARANDPGVALQEALGLAIPVPVSEIAQWLKGEKGAATSAKYDGNQLLESLQYVDETGTRWRAVFRKRTDFQGSQVPSLITAKGGPYQVRIVLNNWSNLDVQPLDVVPKTEKQKSQRLSIPTQ